MTARFFATAGEWREWLEANHASETELLVGMYKRGSGRPSMTWPESVDEALCFGWIDAVRGSIDEESYTVRFCVRKAGSIWSNVNIAKAEALIRQGKMHAAGLAKFAGRTAAKSGIYSFEQARVEFEAEAEARFRREPTAWEFWQSQPPGYRKRLTWWVSSARLAATREKRLGMLIAACLEQRRF